MTKECRNPNDEGLSSRRGLTLIEMLVGMAITLIMMAAVVNLFANISAGIRNRQGKMELNAATRLARSKLYDDLARATVFQKTDVRCCEIGDDSSGYFEYVEGRRSDEDPTGLDFNPATSTLPSTSLVPSSNAVLNSEGDPIDPTVLTDGRALGDFDDILAFTIRNEENPFRGRGRALRPGADPLVPNINNWIDLPIQSPMAEVVWFCVENPADGSLGEPGMRRVYRRTFLIAPWFGVATDPNTQNSGTDPILDFRGKGLNFRQQLALLRAFQARYDVSVRLEGGRIVPNTLADLSRRECRFGHLPNNTFASPNVYHFPHPFPYTYNSNEATDTYDVYPGIYANAGELTVIDGSTTYKSSLQPLANEQTLRPGSSPISAMNSVAPPPMPADHYEGTADERNGEDLILNDVLAFDVQVYDPGAPVYEVQGSTLATSAVRINGNPNAFLQVVNSGAIPLGFGAYVDLGWNNSGEYNYMNVLNAPPTSFQQERQVGWHPGLPLNYRGTPAVYDTWTSYYEHDQIDQDNRDTDDDYTTGADEGSNGLDDLANYYDPLPLPPSQLFEQRYGPDDTNERETSPPYPTPLTGVKVRLRVYEPDTRQIRETTVVKKIAK